MSRYIYFTNLKYLILKNGGSIILYIADASKSIRESEVVAVFVLNKSCHNIFPRLNSIYIPGMPHIGK
jgi:hypothetical protein